MMFVGISTPDWIRAHVEVHGGGWFHPISLSPSHPLVAEPWSCFVCNDPFKPHDVAMVMPFAGEDGSRWIAEHRECSARQILSEPSQLAKMRPPDYGSLSPADQWAADKRLGILDWDGSDGGELL